MPGHGGPGPEQVTIASERGPNAALFHDCDPARGSVLTVGGFNGGFDGPANGIYGDLGVELPKRNIAVLRLDFRVKTSPGPIGDGIFDVRSGVHWLRQRGKAPVVLIGHSYGGAIVIRAALRTEAVCAVAALSTQSAGIERVQELAPRPLLLVHGAADQRLPARLSEWVYAQASEPKTLHILEGATHSLRQQRDALWSILTQWIDQTIPPAAHSAG